MKFVSRILIAGISLLVASVSYARGVSPYLPLDMDPQIERQIERVLILAGKPVMRRPIAAAVVLDALPTACQRDEQLCEEVRRYLQEYMKPYGLTSVRPTISLTTGDSTSTIPNAHGEQVDSAWRIFASAYYQPFDHLIVSAGGVGYDGEVTATGSFLSAGVDWAQLDIGFRDRWLSPLADSSSLVSTEASTMPSITLSNYAPIGPLGFNYEISLAQMSEQENIAINDTTTDGNPCLAGLQLGLEPVIGYAIAFNRLVQYGGGARGENCASDFFDQAFELSNRDPGTTGPDGSNRVASLTSSILFPGPVPMAVRAEYAGEDNAYRGNYLLGATNFSLGLDFPLLWKHFDFTYELSEWQNDWYIHYLYPLGLTNEGNVIGHWFGDQRQFADAIGGSSHMLRGGWRTTFGYWQATYRTLKPDADWRRVPSDIRYERMHALSVNLSANVRGWPINAEINAGKDVFGDSFARLSASVDFAHLGRSPTRVSDEEVSGDTDVAWFIDVGGVYNQVRRILAIQIPETETDWATSAHLGFGVRRNVSRRSDLSVRLEIDEDIDGHELFSFRAVDYRFRLTQWLAFNGFFGVGRYDIRLPAYGYYWGAGLQLMDILPKWDLSVDARHHEKLGRDKTLLPEDPPIEADRSRMFFDVDSLTLYVTRRF